MGSKIESFTIQSELIELKGKWSHYTKFLTKISVKPDNLYFKTYDDKMIIRKSSLDEENYDQLVFCVRGIQKVKKTKQNKKKTFVYIASMDAATFKF